MPPDNSASSPGSPFSSMALKLYSNNQGGTPNGAPAPQSNASPAADGTNPGTGDRFANLFKTLEKDPNNGYNKEFDRRHPELQKVTPELRPFVREVMMRQELKGWNPKIQRAIGTEKEERRHMADGTSGVTDPKNSRHIDLGNGADAADVTDERYGWGKGKNEKGPAADFKDQRAKAYFKDQQDSFEETQKRWGAGADRFRWGGYWHKPYDPAHIENHERVTPDDEDDAN